MSDIVERLRMPATWQSGAGWWDRCQEAADEIERLRRELAEAHGSGEKLREAILWALGERDTFPDEPEPLAGKYRRRYWWRTELRRRAFGTAPDQPSAARAFTPMDRERLQRKIQGDPDDGDVSAGQFLPHKFDGTDDCYTCEACGRESDHPIHTVNPADQPNAVKPCADCGEPTDVWHDGTHLCWKCRA